MRSGWIKIHVSSHLVPYWSSLLPRAVEVSGADGPALWRKYYDPRGRLQSCPRAPQRCAQLTHLKLNAQDRLVNEAGVEAILCLQSDDCLDALGIPMQARDRRGTPCRARRGAARLRTHESSSLNTSLSGNPRPVHRPWGHPLPLRRPRLQPRRPGRTAAPGGAQAARQSSAIPSTTGVACQVLFSSSALLRLVPRDPTGGRAAHAAAQRQEDLCPLHGGHQPRHADRRRLSHVRPELEARGRSGPRQSEAAVRTPVRRLLDDRPQAATRGQGRRTHGARPPHC